MNYFVKTEDPSETVQFHPPTFYGETTPPWHENMRMQNDPHQTVPWHENTEGSSYELTPITDIRTTQFTDNTSNTRTREYHGDTRYPTDTVHESPVEPEFTQYREDVFHERHFHSPTHRNDYYDDAGDRSTANAPKRNYKTTRKGNKESMHDPKGGVDFDTKSNYPVKDKSKRGEVTRSWPEPSEKGERRIIAANYSAVEIHGFFGLIDDGSAGEGRMLIVHVPKWIRGYFLDIKQGDTINVYHANGGKIGGKLTVLSTGRHRYYAPGRRVTTCTICVPEEQWAPFSSF